MSAAEVRPAGTGLTNARAVAVLRAAMTYAENAGMRVSIVVVDERGFDVVLERSDGAAWFTPALARAKARTAAAFGARSESMAPIREQRPEVWALIAQEVAFTPTALAGGVPIVSGGRILGAIGVSGDKGHQDALAADAGAAAVDAGGAAPS
ncbi:MAG TPA: heme-binding protein [Nakamurella sp.]